MYTAATHVAYYCPPNIGDTSTPKGQEVRNCLAEAVELEPGAGALSGCGLGSLPCSPSGHN